LIIDGSSKSSGIRQGDIGIKGDRIEKFGDLSGATATTVSHASGLIVSPGFIDTHTHSEFTLLADGRAEGKISQGITTEIHGNCGMSAAPLYGPAVEHREKELDELSLKERWNSFSEYYSLLNKKGFTTNFVTLVGHGNLRASVMGFSNREPNSKEKQKMFELLEDALDSGARGISTGLVYPPGVYAHTPEILELTKETVKQGGFVYTTHMRDEGDNILDSVEEALRIGSEAKIHVHISHLKTYGKSNWEKIGSVIKKMFQAQQGGLDLTCDRYPYTAAATDLDAMLPAWAYKGGHKEELKRLQNERKRLSTNILKAYPDETSWDAVHISSVNTAGNKWMEGRSLLSISRQLEKPPVDCLFDILTGEKLRVGAIFYTLSEDNLKTILTLPYSMIGSDSSAKSFTGVTAQGKPHPRGFGSFPKVLGKYVREEKILSLTEAVHKMTGLPAKVFKINQRGTIHQGFFADITVFHPEKIQDRATYDNPFQQPEGVYYVFVNGKPVLWEGKQTDALSGRIL
jgi:N-acyl-D-amino-acid deacylase